MDVGKIVETRNPLSNTIKDTSTIMCNPLPELCREGLRMIVLVSLIVLLRGFLVSTIFHMVHPYIRIIYCTCVPHIFRNARAATRRRIYVRILCCALITC